MAEKKRPARNSESAGISLEPDLKRDARQLAEQMGFGSLSCVLYRSIFDLASDMPTNATPADNARLQRLLLKPDLLIIDDMGLKNLPARSGEILLEIIMRRHENRSTLMTSNRPVEEWGQLLGDIPAASAILDRLLHRSDIIAITGPSYRLHQSTAHHLAATAAATTHQIPQKSPA
jgi:DNA replication protein DnaC